MSFRVNDSGAVPCVTLYSYTAGREDELSFEAGHQLVGACTAVSRLLVPLVLCNQSINPVITVLGQRVCTCDML